ncbi:hypothetical protein D6817_04480 [Candidatus Pacearchaeota archaeon]|nr:MAG: hypothetical protein D6817_04480 [Candidatus Pacearchaeota archaeon]
MDADALERLLAEVNSPSYNFEEGLYTQLMRFGPRKISKQYPVMDVTDEVAEVVQGNFGITDSNDEKPIIATSALFTCIGLLGYDREHNLGFLMHIQSSNDVEGGLESLYQELARTHPDYEKEFDTHIVASTFRDFQNYRDLEEALRRNPSGLGTKLKASSPIEFTPDMKGEGIALDTRSGKIFAYLRGTLAEGPCDFKYNHPIPEKRWFEFGSFR